MLHLLASKCRRTRRHTVQRLLRLSRACTQLVPASGEFSANQIILSPAQQRPFESDGNCCSQTFAKAAVAADAKQCSQIGVGILRQGGNAIDAAVAAMLGVGVVNLHSTGIGGGGFMMIYNSRSRTSHAIDFRDKAPMNASARMYKNTIGFPELPSRYGGLAIAVPGMLHGLYSVWRRFGRLPWENILQPVIDLAVDGFTVTKDIMRAINFRRELILSGDYPGLQDLLAPNGEFLNEGDQLCQIQLAGTLEAIAEHGIGYFYDSSFTEEMVEELQQDYGSILTVEDFQKYSSVERPVVTAKFKNHTMLSIPPPACGATLGLILNMLDAGSDFSEDCINTNHFHRLIETFKFAFGQRYYIGDPDYNETINSAAEYMLDPRTAECFLSQIDDSMTHDTSYYTDPRVIPEQMEYDYGTTHLSVLDQDGTAVSVTTTLNLFFGSLVRSKTSGVIFNNEMDNFDIAENPVYKHEHANTIMPMKRPRSASAPTILLNEDGSIRMVIGASGGAMIPSALAQVIVGVLGFKWPLRKAISYPRLHHEFVENLVVADMDVAFPLTYLNGLLGKGHVVTDTVHRAVVQGIHVDTEGVHATSDFRKGGVPDGY